MAPPEGSPLFSLLSDLANGTVSTSDFRGDSDFRTRIMVDYGLSTEQQEAMNSALVQNRLLDFMNEVTAEAIRTRASC